MVDKGAMPVGLTLCMVYYTSCSWPV